MLCRIDISERELTARRTIAISILGVGIERYSKGQRPRAPRFLCRSASLSIVEASCSIAELAQLVEHWFCTPEAGGSSPPLSTIWDVAQLVEQVTVNHRVGGSSPSIPAIAGIV